MAGGQTSGYADNVLTNHIGDSDKSNTFWHNFNNKNWWQVILTEHLWGFWHANWLCQKSLVLPSGLPWGFTCVQVISFPLVHSEAFILIKFNTYLLRLYSRLYLNVVLKLQVCNHRVNVSFMKKSCDVFILL